MWREKKKDQTQSNFEKCSVLFYFERSVQNNTPAIEIYINFI